MQQHTVLTAYLRNFAHGLNHARLVIRGHDRNQPRLWADRFGELIEVHNSISRNIQPSHFEILALFQMFERIQDSMMFPFIRDDMTAA